MSMYIIINKENGAVLSRLVKGMARTSAVKSEEVPHNENGLVSMLDVLKVMGYKIEQFETAVFPDHGPMSKESRYNLDSLTMICFDPETGIIC